MKLKIAARLINKDRNRAFEIVKQVAESPVGLIATTDDDFVYNKGKFDNNWNNDFSVGVGTQHLIDFLVNNKDPRLLYFFQRMTTILMLCRLILIKKRNAGFCRKECNF